MEDLLYLGILPMSLHGSVVDVHVWDDGSTIPVLAGFDASGDDDGDDDGDEEDDDESGTDEDDDDDEDDEDDPKKIKDPKRRRAARQAAAYRTQRNEARTQRDALRTEVSDLKTKLRDAESKGTGDESLKTRITELETELNDAKSKLTKAESEQRSVSVDRQVKEALDDRKEKFREDADLVRYHLERAGLLKVDEESGDIEDLDKSIGRLKRLGKIHVVSDDDDSDDDDDAGASGSSVKKSSGRPMNGKKKAKGDYDRKTLEDRYPALRR